MGAVVLPVVFAVLCAATDVIAAILLFCTFQHKERVYLRRVVFGLFVTTVQQVLLLLEMFTLFREVSFFFVFSPLLVIVAVIIVDSISSKSEFVVPLTGFACILIPS